MKIDLSKTQKTYYKASKNGEILELPAYQYVSIEGQGDPNGTLFGEHITAMYQVSYTFKKIYKDLDQDFVVPKLEGLWWVDDVENYLEIPRSEWHYKLLIKMPEFVDMSEIETIKEEVFTKKGNVYVKNIEKHEMMAQEVAHILHLGPYSEEPQTLQKLYDHIEKEAYKITGLHHEVYLSDPRKTAPEKLRTILRYPVEKK